MTNTLNSKLLEAFQNFTFDDSEPEDKYFKDKLKKLKFDDYNDLMKRYIIEAASFGSVDMNEFDKDIDELLTKEKIILFNDPLVQAVIELKSKRIIAQQKRRMNSYGRWSKIMRDKYE